MTYARSRRLRKVHFNPFFGDPEATVESLLKQLNGASEDRVAIAVRQLVEDMNAVDQLVRSRPYPSWTRIEFEVSLDHAMRKRGFEPAVAERMKRIRKAYDRFGIELMPVFPRKAFWIFQRLSPVQLGRYLPWISLATIHGLAAEGRLRQVRKCPCGEWFYAYRPSEKYRFHDDSCRDKYYRHTPEGKARRCTYMRGYRSRLKKQDQANLEASKTHPRKRLK
jgi:hypothetical protein